MSFSDREPCDFIVDFETQQDSTVLGLRVGAIDAVHIDPAHEASAGVDAA